MNSQKVVVLDNQRGDYYNFFFTPGSMDSLKRMVNCGWYVKFIKDGPEAQRAVVVFECENAPDLKEPK